MDRDVDRLDHSLFDALSAEQRRQLLTILAWEADKQVEYGISREHNSMPGHWPEHSVGEANAWSCALLQTARSALPDSPRQTAWRDTAITYSLNAISVPADVISEEVSHELYFGMPVDAPPRRFEPGQWIRDLVALVDCERRDAAPQQTAAISGSHPCFAVQLMDTGRTVAINFADTQQTAQLPGGPILLAPLSLRNLP